MNTTKGKLDVRLDYTGGNHVAAFSSPPLRIGQSSSLNLTFGGAESNVACNLARLGRMTSWWSRLPDNPLAHQLVAMLRYHGVDTQQVTFCEGERLGTYYIEYGTTRAGFRFGMIAPIPPPARCNRATFPANGCKTRVGYTSPASLRP
ncbi:MAG UNVERIFIED_CONTAM: PfkB family carbohydrate kinase [Anaerolineae bacterium]|jgi:sugar/nucleoside kinase (ribokinase family)